MRRLTVDPGAKWIAQGDHVARHTTADNLSALSMTEAVAAITQKIDELYLHSHVVHSKRSIRPFLGLASKPQVDYHSLIVKATTISE